MRPAIVAAALLVLVVSSAQATPPGRNGRIVFERLRFQNTPWGELFVMNADGSGVRRLTSPPNGTENTNADWSSDGRRIVYASAPPTGAVSIWTIDADGGDARRISPPCPPGAGIPRCKADDGWPAWSPDASHLVFQRLSGALQPKGATINTATAIYKDELVVTDADGSHSRTLVWVGPWRGDPQSPAWSPDGKRIAFIGKHMTSKTNGTGCECRAVYVVDVDGSRLHRITRFGLRPGGRLDWSPDGSTILFRTHPGDDPSGIGATLYTVHPDGSGLRRLRRSDPTSRVLDGSYSPDGASIVFETSAGAVGGVLPDVFVMNADGTGIRRVTATRNFETGADWGPR